MILTTEACLCSHDDCDTHATSHRIIATDINATRLTKSMQSFRVFKYSCLTLYRFTTPLYF